MFIGSPYPHESTTALSPDGRTIISTTRYTWPGDIHEAGWWHVTTVLDAATRATVFSFDAYHDYPSSAAIDENGIILAECNGVRFRIDRRSNSWATERDGWATHSLDGDLTARNALLSPLFPRRYVTWEEYDRQPKQVASRVGNRLLLWLGLPAAVIAIIAYPFLPGRESRESGSGEATENARAWQVRCPWDDRVIAMSLTPDGQLTVSQWLSPKPLALVARINGLYKAGPVSVRIEGRNAAISRGTTVRTCESVI